MPAFSLVRSPVSVAQEDAVATTVEAPRLGDIMNALSGGGVALASDSFEITLSVTVAPEQVMQALAALVPSGTRVAVQAEFPDSLGGVWVEIIESGADTNWPCFLSISCLGVSGLSPQLDLQLAQELWERFGVDSICSTHPFVEHGPDPHDPFWALACVKGQWHLAELVAPH